MSSKNKPVKIAKGPKSGKARKMRSPLERATDRIKRAVDLLSGFVGWPESMGMSATIAHDNANALAGYIAKLPADFEVPRTARGSKKPALYAEGAKVRLSEKGKNSFGWVLGVGDADREFVIVKCSGKKIMVKSMSGVTVTGSAAHLATPPVMEKAAAAE